MSARAERRGARRAVVDDPALRTPVLTSFLDTGGHRPPWWVIATAAVLTGAVAGLVTARLAAPIIAAAVVLGCLVRRSRPLFVLAPVILLAATGDYVAQTQIGLRYISNIGWPAAFPDANTLTWMAVVALMAGAVVEVARWRPWSLPPVSERTPASAPLSPPALAPETPIATQATDTGVVAADDISSEGDPAEKAVEMEASPAETEAEAGEDTAESDEPGTLGTDAATPTADEDRTQPEALEGAPDGEDTTTPTIPEADEPPVSD